MMRYNINVFKHSAEIDINANSAIEAEQIVKELLPDNKDFILKIKAVKPTKVMVILNNKISATEE